jgi:hypothetical protein
LEVADWVDLVAAPGFHVGDGSRDGWVLVVHACSVLSRVSMRLIEVTISGCWKMTYRLAASAVIRSAGKDPEPDLECVRVCNSKLCRHETSAGEPRDGN